MSVQLNKQLYLNELQELGLSEEEAMLYIFLLENGPKTHLEISRETNLNRSKIYRISEKLTQKNILEESNTAWGKKIKAAPAENLELLIKADEEKLESRKRKLPNLITTLSSISSSIPGKFEVIHYKGIEGLKQMLWNDLKAKEVLAFGYQSTNDFVGKKFADTLREKAVRRKVHYKEIGNETNDDNSYNSALGWEKVFEYRQIDEKVLKIQQTIEIYNNTVAILNWINGDLAGIEIISDEYANLMRQIFNFFWNLVEE